MARPRRVALQLSLGVATLRLIVPTALGVAHQLGALIRPSAATVAFAELRGPAAEAEAAG